MLVLIMLCLFICLIDCSGSILTGRVKDLLYCGYFDEVEDYDEDKGFNMESLNPETNTGMSVDDFETLDKEDQDLYMQMHGKVDERKSLEDATALLEQIYGGGKH